MISILDNKIGNVRSVQKAVERAIRAANVAQRVALTADPDVLRMPQIGWNQLRIRRPDPRRSGVPSTKGTLIA